MLKIGYLLINTQFLAYDTEIVSTTAVMIKFKHDNIIYQYNYVVALVQPNTMDSYLLKWYII